MPIKFTPTSGGVFRNGYIQGAGEIHEENIETGSGSVYIGNFTKSKLNDVNGVYIMYTNSRVTKYSGSFIDNKLDGTVNILEYQNDFEDGDDEKEHAGNGSNNNGRKYIAAANRKAKLNGRKKQILFSNGNEISTLSDVEQKVKIDVKQAAFGTRLFFSEFNITEDAAPDDEDDGDNEDGPPGGGRGRERIVDLGI